MLHLSTISHCWKDCLLPGGMQSEHDWNNQVLVSIILFRCRCYCAGSMACLSPWLFCRFLSFPPFSATSILTWAWKLDRLEFALHFYIHALERHENVAKKSQYINILNNDTVFINKYFHKILRKKRNKHLQVNH